MAARLHFLRSHTGVGDEKMGENTVVVTDANFEDEVIQSDRPVLVDFWAEWCGPCKMIAPVLDEIATELDGKLTIGKLDVDENQSTAMAFGVMSIPTLMLFKDGQQVETIVGFQQKAQLLGKIQAHLN
jgi:thioredoxin 1